MPVIMILAMRTIHASTPGDVRILSCFEHLFPVDFFPPLKFPTTLSARKLRKDTMREPGCAPHQEPFLLWGNALGYVMPLWILDIFPGNQETGWQTIGDHCIVLSGQLAGFFFFADPKKNSSGRREEGEEEGNVIKGFWENYFQLCKLRTMRLLIIYKAAFSCAFAVFNIGTIYYLQYSLGLDNRYSSYVFADHCRLHFDDASGK